VRLAEHGFTLVELLLSLVLATIIGGVVVAALITSLNASDSTTDQVSDSTDAGLISAYLIRDAQSAGGIDPASARLDPTLGVSTDPADTGSADCLNLGRTGTDPPAPPVTVRFSWIDRSSATTKQTKTVVYAVDGQKQLMRRECEGGTHVDAVLGSSIERAVASCVPSAQPCAGQPRSVELHVWGSGTRAPFDYILTASLRTATSQLAIVSPLSLPSASLNAPYTTTLTTIGAVGWTKWSWTNLPDWLHVGPNDPNDPSDLSGVVWGTPLDETPAAFTVTVTDSTGAKASMDYTLEVGDAGLGIFLGHQDLGGTGRPGDSRYVDPTYTVQAGKGDIGSAGDAFQYVYRPLTGDGRLTVRVASQTTNDKGSQAGVMFRETLDAASSFVMADITESNGGQFVYRNGAGTDAVASADSGGPAPYWLRLTRVGDVFTAERSVDGATWTGLQQVQIPMAQTIYVGLAVTAHNNSVQLSKATFDHAVIATPAAVSTTANALGYVENATTAVDSGVTIVDADSADLQSAIVAMTSGYVNGQDTLAFTDQSGISGSWSASTGVLSLTGLAAVSDYQAALASVTYSNSSDTPNTGTRTVSFSVNDDVFTSNIASRSITVSAVNDAPVAAADSYSVNEDTPLTVSAVAGVLANDTDVEANLLTAKFVSGAAVILNTNGSFTYVPPANFYGTTSFTYQANDGSSNSNVVTVTMTVVPVNDAPSFTEGADQSVPMNAGAQTVNGWATSISQGNGDTGQAVDFIVTNDQTSKFSVQPAVSPTGTLTYTPATNATGAATVSVVIHDNAGTANGGVDRSAAQTFTITVSAPSLVVTSPSPIASLPGAVTGTISNFLVGQTLTYRLDSTTGPVLSGSPSTVTSSVSMAVSVTVPAGTSDAPHRIFVVSSGGTSADAAIDIAIPPALQSMQMRDSDSDGRIDQVTVVFDDALAAYTAGPAPWTLTNVPSGGSLSSVSVAGNTATLTITEGAGAPDTAVGAFKVALAADSAGIRDVNSHPSSFPATGPADSAKPIRVSLSMLDGDGDGKVDTVTGLFSEPLAAYSAPNSVWTLVSVPSSGSLSSVSVAGSTATLTLTEGAGAADTAVGSMTVAMTASSTGVRDAAGNQASFTAATPIDKAAPVPLTITDTNGGTNGKAQSGDTIVITFSEPLAAASVPSLTTVTLADPSGTGNDTLALAGISNGAGDLGSDAYVTTNGGTAAFPNSVVVLSNANKTITVTIGSTCTSVCATLGSGATANYVFVAANTLKDVAGNVAGSTPKTISIRMF